MQVQVRQYDDEILKETNLLGFSHLFLESDDSNFLGEIKEYECPIRFLLFLDKNKNKYEVIYKDYFISEYNDIKLDFSHRNMEYRSDIYFDLILSGNLEKFIEMTPEYNKYGKIGF